MKRRVSKAHKRTNMVNKYTTLFSITDCGLKENGPLFVWEVLGTVPLLKEVRHCRLGGFKSPHHFQCVFLCLVSLYQSISSQLQQHACLCCHAPCHGDHGCQPSEIVSKHPIKYSMCFLCHDVFSQQ